MDMMEENDAELDEMLYNIAFSDEHISRDKAVFERLGCVYKAGETIVDEGDSSTQLFLVLSGSLRIIKSPGTSEEKAIAVLTEGEIFGEMSYFDNLPRSASVVAVVDSKVIVLERKHFELIFQMHPRWTQKIIQTLSNRIYLAYLDLKDHSEFFVV